MSDAGPSNSLAQDRVVYADVITQNKNHQASDQAASTSCDRSLGRVTGVDDHDDRAIEVDIDGLPRRQSLGHQIIDNQLARATFNNRSLPRPIRDIYNEQAERDSLNVASSSVRASPETNQDSARADSSGPHLPVPDLAAPGVAGLDIGRGVRARPARARTLLSLLSGRTMFHGSEPFGQLWITLSSLYGKLVVTVMLAFCLTEVMDNSVRLLSLQGIYLMYLYVGCIGVILCIYVWVLLDSCASLHGDGSDDGLHCAGGGIAGGRFGSLRRAHISRDKTSGTSFYLRIGALAFGLGTLVFNGLEMAMHSMMEGDCLNDVVFVHPVLHGLFTFLQMHFLFVNSQVLVERFGPAARFGFMHLAATNLALWVRLVVWESGNEWSYLVFLAQSDTASYAVADRAPTPLQLRGYPRSVSHRQVRDLPRGLNSTYRLISPGCGYAPVSEAHLSQVVSLHQCLNTNSLGQLWTSSMPFLYPFIIQFSIIAAAVTFIMGQNVGKERFIGKKMQAVLTHKAYCGRGSNTSSAALDCTGASKGLFLGLLFLVGGVVIIIIFLVVKDDEDFPAETVFWLTTGLLATVLSLSILMSAIGLVQIRKLPISHSYQGPSSLDRLLAGISSAGVQLYSIFGIVVGAAGLAVTEPQRSGLPDGSPGSADSSDQFGWMGLTNLQRRHAMLLAVSALELLQASLQSGLLSEALLRKSHSHSHSHSHTVRPARQALTFLLCSNAILWAYDTFVAQSWLSQELQLRFFGVLAWGVISRVALPLVVFYRFHSSVLLLDAWKRCYRSPTVPHLHDLLEAGN